MQRQFTGKETIAAQMCCSRGCLTDLLECLVPLALRQSQEYLVHLVGLTLLKVQQAQEGLALPVLGPAINHLEINHGG